MHRVPRATSAATPRRTASASSSACRRGRRTRRSSSTADDCLGWCQFGSPSELPRIKSRKEYEKGLADLPDWRIACNFVGKGHRRKGVASAGLAGALELIARSRRRRGRGLPESADSVPAGFLFNGALSTYEKLGFIRDRQIGKHRWVVRKTV